MRRIALVAARRSVSASVRSVRVAPGWTRFTVMPWGPSWSASVLVRCTMAALRRPLMFPERRPMRPYCP